MADVILVKITDNIEDLKSQGEDLAAKVLTNCNYTEKPIKLYEIKNPTAKYYALVDYNQCLDEYIKSGAIEYLSNEEFEEIDETPNAISEVEFENEGATNTAETCILF